MANDFFTAAAVPSTGASLASATIRNEFAAIEDGFDKLPTMTGNGSELVAVNSSGTALEAVTTGTGILSFLATPSSANLRTAVTDETGTGALVFATSPTLVTPVLGVATATSVNKVAITAPATSATLTIADGKTLTNSNTLTLTATDGSTLAIGAGGTLATAAYLTGVSARYTPTVTAVTNCTNASVVTDWHYIRLGDRVMAAGQAFLSASAAGVVEMAVTLPVTSDFAASAGLCAGGGAFVGVIGTGPVFGAAVFGDTTNDRAIFTFTSTGTHGSGSCWVWFMYTVV